jgi:hypothetical protein
LIFQNGRVETDSGILLSTDPIIQRGVQVVTERPKFAIETYDSFGTKLIGAYVLLTNHFEFVTYKRFLKFQDVIANFGGVVKAFMLISQIVIYSYNKNSFLLDLFESLYSSRKIKTLQNDNSSLLTIYSKDGRINQLGTETHRKQIQEKNLDMKNNFYTHSINNTKNKIFAKQPAKLKLLDFMFNYGSHKVLYHKIKNLIWDKLDVKTLFRTQDDVQKLKCLLLSKNEIEILEKVANNKILDTLYIDYLEEDNEMGRLLNMMCLKRKNVLTNFTDEEIIKEYKEIYRKINQLRFRQ